MNENDFVIEQKWTKWLFSISNFMNTCFNLIYGYKLLPFIFKFIFTKQEFEFQIKK